MTWRFLLLTTLTASAFAQEAGNPDWHKPFPPFRIVGNVYWVGTWDLSSYLITTPQGHILINTGFPDSVPMIISGVESLGFKFSDIKILTSTHAHSDHVAGLAEIKRLTGAKMLMEEEDVAVVETGGRADFRAPDNAPMRFDPVKVDQRLKDGDKIALGGVELTAHHHPGHTKGATSFSLNVRDGQRDYRVLIANMDSINPGVKVSGMPKYPNITADYARTFHEQKDMQLDIWLSSHAAQFDMHKKHQPGDPYNPDKFVDAQGFHASVDRLEKIYRDHLEEERRAAPVPAAAQKDVAVPILRASYHLPVFKNEYVTLLKIEVPPGRNTGYHTHTGDSVSVNIVEADMTNQDLGAPQPGPAAHSQRGRANYADYRAQPRSHRASNVGSTPFQNISMIFNSPQPGGFTPSSRTGGYTQIIDNARVRGWRMALEPGQSSASVTQTAPGLRVILDGGEIVESVPGQPDRGMNLKLGEFYWQDPGITRVIRNIGTTRLDLIEFELK
jgi:metallo-beta-lactamase class B